MNVNMFIYFFVLCTYEFVYLNILLHLQDLKKNDLFKEA